MRDKLLDLIAKSSNTYARYLAKSHPEIFAWVNVFPGATIAEKSYNALHGNMSNEKFCENCQAPITDPFITVVKGYRKFCGNFCSTTAISKRPGCGFKSAKFIASRKKTLLVRYGTNSMISINRNKAIATNRVKFGVDYPLQSAAIRQKVSDNLLAEHGVTNIMHLVKTVKKIKQTLLENYGVTSPLKSPEIRKKFEETMIDRFGVIIALQNQELVTKKDQTNLSRYGVTNPMQNEDIAKKTGRARRQTEINNGSVDQKIDLFKKRFLVEAQFSHDDYLNGLPLTWKHVCGKIYISGWGNGMLMICPEPNCRKQSSPQRAVYETIRELLGENVEIKVNTRAEISPYELDIYVPSKNLAVELDGVYFHQDEKEGLNKIELCEKIGITLLHITDLSWHAREDVWRSIISSKLGMQERVFARKCKITQESSFDSRSFLEKNHLQGTLGGQAWGLRYQGELVALMTFGKPRFNSNYDWELLRYCSKLGVTVVGGASKLFKVFRSKESGSIVTYARKEYSRGHLYQILGFQLLNKGSPSYFYLKNNKTLTRHQAQKHKLQKLLGDSFDPALSEKENMILAGYLIVPERGSYTYVLEPPL